MRGRSWVRSALAIAFAAALLALAGCGSDEDDPYTVPDRFQDYCEEIEDQRVSLGETLAAGPTTGLIDALPIFEELAAKAPEDVADDWDVVIGRIEDLVSALEAAGVDPDTYDRRNPPAGLDKEQKEAIDAAATALVSVTTSHAMSSVQQHSRDVCKTPLTL